MNGYTIPFQIECLPGIKKPLSSAINDERGRMRENLFLCRSNFSGSYVNFGRILEVFLDGAQFGGAN